MLNTDAKTYQEGLVLLVYRVGIKIKLGVEIRRFFVELTCMLLIVYFLLKYKVYKLNSM